MPINLNIQLSGAGDGARVAAPLNASNPVHAPNQAVDQSSYLSTNNSQQQSAQRIRRMKNLFPTITDFLVGLDQDPDNSETPRHVEKYTVLLTSPDHLGYGRIHELILAVKKSPTPGADWLKERIERAAKEADLPIRINEGTASFIYEEMLDKFEGIIAQNGSN
jgi:hypothetical protein